MPGRTGTFKEDPATGRLIVPQGLIDAIGGEEFGGLGPVVIRPYTGDDTNSRILDLGADFDVVIIIPADPRVAAADHLGCAYAVGTVYGLFSETAATEVFHVAMTSADGFFRGKLTGVDATKIRLGTSGANASGTNKSGFLYLILGLRFPSPRS